MPEANDHHAPLPEDPYLWQTTRARILRDATALFLKRNPDDAGAVSQYAELAAGLLPRIDRTDAIAIAHVLASAENLPDSVLRSFVALGIKINYHTFSPPIYAHQPSDGNLRGGINIEDGTSRLPANRPMGPAKEHLSMGRFSTDFNENNISSEKITGADYLAIIRTCERRDVFDFTFHVVRILSSHSIYPTTEQISTILEETSREPLVMIIAAIGGDRRLLAKALDAFTKASDRKLSSIRQAMQYYETIDQVLALKVLSNFFRGPLIAKIPTGQHVSVQSGKSVNLSLRKSAQSSIKIDSVRLSERLKKAPR